MEWIVEVVYCGVEYLDVVNKIIFRCVIDFMFKYLYVSKMLVFLSFVNVGFEDFKFEVFLFCFKSIYLDNVCYMGDDVFVIMERFILGFFVLKIFIMDVFVLKKKL